MKSPANYHEARPDTQSDITDIDSIIEINVGPRDCDDGGDPR